MDKTKLFDVFVAEQYSRTIRLTQFEIDQMIKVGLNEYMELGNPFITYKPVQENQDETL